MKQIDCLKSKDYMTSLYHRHTKYISKAKLVHVGTGDTVWCEVKLLRPNCMLPDCTFQALSRDYSLQTVKGHRCEPYSTLNNFIKSASVELLKDGYQLESVHFDIEHNRLFPEIKEFNWEREQSNS